MSATREITILQEDRFGRFPMLIANIQAWVREHRDTVTVIRSIFTTVNGKLRNENHRACKIIYKMNDGVAPASAPVIPFSPPPTVPKDDDDDL